jgi:L,D-peptidoglycan transpeptidase YkuD (ErfK/YbiS/YcfS/YnhG family)
MVRAPYPHSAERLWRGDPLYDPDPSDRLELARAERGRGSAIFLHRWRGPGKPTEGCVAWRRITCAGSWRISVTAHV